MTDIIEKCPNNNCFAPETPCNLGEHDLSRCPFWKGSTKNTKDLHSEDGYLLPWTGNTLGTADLEFVAGRSKPQLIGVAGSQNAGKTTLLTVLYLLLARGHRVANRTFAGSYTLGGWENLANFMRWHGNQGPTFPPHTSRSIGRRPGLLHLALRDELSVLHDILLTDAPGEWFERWSFERLSPEAQGARWISDYSDSIILFADSDALSGPNIGVARGQLEMLLQRLSREIGNRRVAVVWSKSDKHVPEETRLRLQGRFAKSLNVYREFSVSVQKTNVSDIDFAPFIDIFGWLLAHESESASKPLVLDTTYPEDNMLAFRGR